MLHFIPVTMTSLLLYTLALLILSLWLYFPLPEMNFLQILIWLSLDVDLLKYFLPKRLNFFFVWILGGPYMAGLRAYSWLCTEDFIPGGTKGITWEGRGLNLGLLSASLRPYHYTISPYSKNFFFKPNFFSKPFSFPTIFFMLWAQHIVCLCLLCFSIIPHFMLSAIT